MKRLRARLLRPRSPVEVQYYDDAIVTVDAEGRIATIGEPDGTSVAQDLRPLVLAPGFIDTHLHAPQTHIVGSASGPLLPWLANSVFPAETEFADVGHAVRVAEAFADRLVAAGTTLSFVYGSVHPHATDAVLAALDRRGLKGIAGPVWMDRDCPQALRLDPGASEDGVRQLVERWHGPRLQVAVIPRFALTSSPEGLQRAGQLARELDLPISTHLAETVAECRLARERFGTADYLQVYEDAGLVSDKSVFAHCIHLTPGEWDRMALAGATVAHCPDSNDFLGSGGMPVDAARSRQIPLTLGTDIGAGRSFAVYRTMSYAFDNARRQGLDLTLAELWWWATRGAAQALGAHETGGLEPGLDADMVALAVPKEAQDAQAVMQHVVFNHDARPVRQVFVAGQAVASR
ncbi:MAG: guanine deaminase [Myxococcota bacterium]